MVIIQFSFLFMISITFCLTGTLCICSLDTEDIANENGTEKIAAENVRLHDAENIGENLRKLAKANNGLTLSVYKLFAKESSKNIFFSPLSLSTAFGMLSLGSTGKTAKELRQIFGFEAAGLPEELVHSTFQHYLTETLPSRNSNAYLITYANAALLDKNLDVCSSFKKQIQDYYQATVKKVDYQNASGEAVEEVNKWVKEKTNGKIDKLLDELDPSTVFVLLSTVYFKGIWKTEFETNKTKPQKFYNNGSSSDAKEVPMMKMKAEFRYTTNSELDVEVIEIPYKGENISMLIMLPKKRDGLGALEKNLSLEKLKAVQLEMSQNKVLLSLPKFKIEYFKEMSEDLKAIGAKIIFTPGADFSRMTDTKNIYVSQVLHKAVVEVNEEGSEAAAVTGSISSRMKQIYPPPEMTVDHPFLFAIVDKRNDMLLFTGRVTNL